MQEYAAGDESVKNAPDQVEGAEQVLFIFVRAVQKAAQELKEGPPRVGGISIAGIREPGS